MLLPFSKKEKTLIKIFTSLFLGILLIFKIDWYFVIKEFRDLKWEWLVPYVFFQVVAILFSVKKWQVIASTYDLNFKTGEGMLTYLKGMFLNNFLPTTIGGDAYRCWWLKEKTGNDIASYASVVLDRVVGLLITTLCAFLLGVFISSLIIENTLFTLTYVIIFGILILSGGLLLSFLNGWNTFGIGERAFLKKKFFQTLFQKRSIRNTGSILFWSGAFTLVGLILSNYLLFLTLDIPLPPKAFSAIILIVILFSNLPVSINNIGIKEWSYATFFVYLGVPIESAVAVALLSRFFQMAISFAVVPITLILEGDGLFKGPLTDNTVDNINTSL